MSKPNQDGIKDLILQHSFSTIIKYGPHSFCITEVARDLHISKKTIYKYFSTKEILVKKCVQDFTSDFISSLIKSIEKELNPVLKFKRIMKFTIRVISNINFEKIINIETKYPSTEKIVTAFIKDYRNIVTGVLIDAQTHGYMHKDFPANTVTLFCSLILRSSFRSDFILKNNLTIKKTSDILLNMITMGILTENGKLHIKKS